MRIMRHDNLVQAGFSAPAVSDFNIYLPRAQELWKCELLYIIGYASENIPHPVYL